VPGYRKLKLIRDNPQWKVLELLDGFGSHVNCYEANVFRSDHNIISLKEAGNSSHINQAYDRFAAKNDKSVQREALNWLQRDRIKNAHAITQWDLLLTGLASVHATRDNPSIWERSFTCTNTRPSTQREFNVWIKEIEPHLNASDSYDLRHLEVDKYKLLPAFGRP
jgi:hypothetical protein